MITGKLIDSYYDSNPIKSTVQVSLYGVSGTNMEPFLGQTNADRTSGEFTFDQSPDAYYITVEGGYQDRFYETHGIKVEFTSDVVPIDIHPVANAQVSGRVITDSDQSKGVSGVLVFVAYSGIPSNISAQTNTDDSGDFTLNGVLPGQWPVRVSKSGYQEHYWSVPAPSSGNFLDIEKSP